jgi:hypothetical protein
MKATTYTNPRLATTPAVADTEKNWRVGTLQKKLHYTLCIKKFKQIFPLFHKFEK